MNSVFTLLRFDLFQAILERENGIDLMVIFVCSIRTFVYTNHNAKSRLASLTQFSWINAKTNYTTVLSISKWQYPRTFPLCPLITVEENISLNDSG